MDALTGVVLAVLALFAIWSLLCRIRLMSPGKTRMLVFLQHAVVALAVFFCAVVSGLDALIGWDRLRALGAHGLVVDIVSRPGIGVTVLMGSIMVFFLMSAHRWRYEAPEGTNIPDEEMKHGRAKLVKRSAQGSGTA